MGLSRSRSFHSSPMFAVRMAEWSGAWRWRITRAERPPEWANAFVLACYHGDGRKADGIHLLGPLSKKVVRIAPPLVDHAR